MNTEQKARFEAIHPKPEYVFWHNVSYRIHTPTLVFDISILTNYQKKWEEFQAAEAPLLARIAELEAELKKTQIRAINLQEEVSGLFTKGELECAVALQSKQIIRLEKQLEERMRMIGEPKLYGDTLGCFKENREPFVVKLPISGYASEAPIGCKIMYADDVKKAITAAGGRCE